MFGRFVYIDEAKGVQKGEVEWSMSTEVKYGGDPCFFDVVSRRSELPNSHALSHIISSLVHVDHAYETILPGGSHRGCEGAYITSRSSVTQWHL